MITPRLDCHDGNPDVEAISEDRWRGTHIDLEKLATDLERVDRADIDLLNERGWREIPEKVLRAILRALVHPRPDNVTR